MLKKMIMIVLLVFVFSAVGLDMFGALDDLGSGLTGMSATLVGLIFPILVIGIVGMLVMYVFSGRNSVSRRR